MNLETVIQNVVAEAEEANLLDLIVQEAGGKAKIARVVGTLILNASDAIERGERVDKSTQESLNKFFNLLMKHEQDREAENLHLLPRAELEERLRFMLNAMARDEVNARLADVTNLMSDLRSAFGDPMRMRKCIRDTENLMERLRA